MSQLKYFEGKAVNHYMFGNIACEEILRILIDIEIEIWVRCVLV